MLVPHEVGAITPLPAPDTGIRGDCHTGVGSVGVCYAWIEVLVVRSVAWMSCSWISCDVLIDLGEVLCVLCMVYGEPDVGYVLGAGV